MSEQSNRAVAERAVRVLTAGVALDGDLSLPSAARAVVVFAHGSGSSRHSPRNRYVAGVLQAAGFATLLMDLLTPDEEQVDARTGALRFDIALLARRLVGATDWLAQQAATRALRVGYFGASTGAAAALVAAAERPEAVGAIVSRGGRLIVGGNDPPVIIYNQAALTQLHGAKRLDIVPGATHLFEEAGALERVAELARDWFLDHLPQAAAR